ncbi:hypothetical protein DFH11DRAFT_323328 [Phellopilus nigrolimitatus]|nr:hypothetical protein DFH11DRAFT_323328 [Phellopilus nigrolimitatus]
MPAESLSSDFSSDHPFALSERTESFISLSREWRQEPPSSPGIMSTSSAPSRYRASDNGLRSQVEHIYTLDTTRNVPWLTVKLRSWAPSSQSLPNYTEGQCITGSVELDLRTPNGIKAITVSLKGYYVIPGHFPKTFLHSSETLWDSSMGDPRSGDMFLSQGSSFSGQLFGKYAWSFTSDLPRTLVSSAKQKTSFGIQRGERLPPSLKTKLGQTQVGYDVIIRIKRYGLRCNSSLTIPIGYTSLSRPGPGSFLRQLAYQNDTPIPFFDSDPSGWRLFPSIEVHGIFYKRRISFTCTLALALPLAYARGSFVPCALVIKSPDPQVAELMTSPRAPCVLLKRMITRRSWPDDEITLDGGEKLVGNASWMPLHNSSVNRQGFEKIAQGEIDLSPVLTPSFKFGKLELKYFVEMLPFDAPGFTPLNGDYLLRVEVVVTSFPAKGPRPKSYLPLAQNRRLGPLPGEVR